MVKQKADLVITHAAQLLTLAGNSQSPCCGEKMQDLRLITDGALASCQGRIMAVGKTDEVLSRVELEPEATIIDANGKVVTPGLVDPHTHIVFAGFREHELAMKLRGVPYLEILAQGGGIISTVRATRQASPEALIAQARVSLDRMLAYGTTTIEAKSGYGLTLEDELKLLRVIKELDCLHPVDLVPTFMGAHAVPPEYKGNEAGFVALVVEEMIPEVARQGLAENCDVFCEHGVFSVEDSRQILLAGQKHGMRSKIHADEIVPLGGAELAAEVGAVSAEHLVHASDHGIQRMAEAGVIAVLLPGTTFYLMGKQYARAREMIARGVPVALSTDYNPGTNPTESLQLIMTIACLQLKMTPEEVITAVTINAAHAIGRADSIGSLEEGKQTDVVIFDAPNYEFIIYHYGVNLVDKVIKKGRLVVDRGRILT